MKRTLLFLAFSPFAGYAAESAPDSSQWNTPGAATLWMVQFSEDGGDRRIPNPTTGAQAGYVKDTSRTFNEYVWVTAHNAFVNRTITGLPNQRLTIKEQLERGVRGFMLDTYNDPIELCHPSWDCMGKLSNTLAEIVSFLNSNKDAVVTVNLEDYTSRSAMQRAFDAVPALAHYTFNPKKWIGRNEWPTLFEMLQADQRLILITSKDANAGQYHDEAYVFYDRDITSENYWSLGDTVFTHNMSCVSRWSGTPLSLKTASYSDYNGWSRLFVMNHFHGLPMSLHSGYDNQLGGDVGLLRRITQYCEPAAERFPNYIAVDFVDQGDVLEYGEERNNGGIIAYEGNNATQDVVCAFSTALRRNINMKGSDSERHGCENDEMRSIVLDRIKAGQRITFFDSPDGDENDDYAVLDILKDTRSAVIPTFEKSVLNENYRLTFHKKNGLDGKISYIKIEPNGAAH